MDQRVKETSDGLSLHYDDICIVCSDPLPGERIGAVKEHEYENTTDFLFPVHRCKGCGLVMLYPRPTNDDLGIIYPKDYYANHFVMIDQGNAGAKKSNFLLDYFYRKSVSMLRKKLAPLLEKRGETIKILDVGCGVGNQLDMLLELFPSAETYGVEPSKLAQHKAQQRGHTTYCEKFEDANLPKSYFDLVISIHVIEHVENPAVFLSKCSEVVKDDGYVLIETPATDCLDFQWFKGGLWGGYHAPRHWYLFDSDNLGKLGRKFGLSIIECKPYCAPPFWSWTAHAVTMKFVGKKIADYLFPPIRMFYGGLHAFLVLGFFSVLERCLLLKSGKASAMWMLFKK